MFIKDGEKDPKTTDQKREYLWGAGRVGDWYFFLQALFVTICVLQFHMYNVINIKLSVKKSMNNIKQSILNT